VRHILLRGIGRSRRVQRGRTESRTCRLGKTIRDNKKRCYPLSEDFICLERRGGIMKASFFERQPDRYSLVTIPMGFGYFE